MDSETGLEKERLPFADLLGVKILTAEAERVTAEMVVREDLCTNPAVLHGGAVMAFADTLGARATILNLRDGAWTTTIESKTNFFAPAQVGTRVTRRMHATTSREAHDGVANEGYLGARALTRDSYADADGARGAEARIVRSGIYSHADRSPSS
jgi:1,4-dihydroxy-2-naphthoyl-CoA hydrolase